MTESEAMDVKGIRLTKQGKFEATINHPSLRGGRVTRNFDTHIAAAQYKVRRLAELRDGTVLPELKKAPMGSPQLSVVLRDYLSADNAKISKSSRETAELLRATLTGTVASVTTTWVDAWVRKMKREDKLAPGTIRKKVECLARCLDWWNRKQHPKGEFPGNPLRNLPKGYSTYDEADVRPGEAIPEDVKRDRRLHAGEYEKIIDAINGVKRADRQRPWGGDDAPDMLMLFRLIVATGMRLREAYRLTWKDVKFNLRTVHVRRSKTGAQRDVPTTRQLEEWLTKYKATRGRDSNVFPYWNGSDDDDVLAALTNKLSTRFGSLFAYAGCEDLKEHDLRHEATCRWMEMRDGDGRFLYRPEEVRRVTGHKNVQMFERYLSLRGSDLAERLA